MKRRTLLAAAGSSTLLVACGGGGGDSSAAPPMSGPAPTPPPPAPSAPPPPASPPPPPSPPPSPPPASPPAPPLVEGQPLRALVRLPNTSSTSGLFSATLTAAPLSIELTAGRQTTVWAYNAIWPGPLIELTEGDRVRVELVNRLPAQPTTVHWHGMPVPAAQDGNPMDPVAAGASRVYEFTLPEGSAATYWYHPHPHGTTHEQVFRGLAGLLIVRPRTDPLPAALVDTPLVFTDLRLDAAGQIAPNTSRDMMLGREGDRLLVNGGLRPVLATAPGATHRLRLCNATNARYLRLAFDGLSMTLVGTDGGLLEAPVAALGELLLAPGERAEVVVRFTAATTLRALSYDRGTMMGMGSTVRPVEALLAVQLQGASVPAVTLPATLRPLAALPAPAGTQRFVLDHSMMGMGGTTFMINGRSFDMNRIDARVRAGDVMLWEIANPDSMDHPFHVHGTQFQVVETVRAGGAVVPAPYRAWKDTVNVARGETVRLRVRQDQRGLRMFHCHILEHEDQGMMGVLEVT